MSKKHKGHQSPQEETKVSFIEIHWEKLILVLLLVLPFIYFASFLSPHRMIAGSDYLIGGYPFEKWTAEQEELPLWYPHIFGGIPVLGAPVGGPLAPLAQLKEIIPAHVVLALTFIIMFFLAGLGMYLYLKKIGLSPYSAAVGAVIYQFIGNLATTPAAGHSGRAASIALFPLMLFFIHSGLSSKKLLYFVLMALVTACAFYEGHFQITYYALLFILGYVIYYFIIHRKEISTKDIIKIVVYGLVAVTLIFLLMAAVWLPVLGGLGTAARGVERGYEYAISWAMPPAELIDLFVPTFSGILQNYWGANPFKQHTEYFGLLTIIFAIFAIILYWKKSYVKFYVIATIAVILTALGGATPFFKILYTIIPGFKLTRAPSLIFYLASFSFIVLAAIGFEYFIIRKESEKKKFYTASGAVLAIFIILIIIAAAIGRDLAGPKAGIYDNNVSQFIQGIFLGVILIVFVLIMIFLALRQKMNILCVTIVMVVLALISQVPLMAKFLPKESSPEIYYAADDIVRFLKKDHSVFRVFPFQSSPPLNPRYLYHHQDCYLLYHNIQSAGGYIPNPIQRYQDFIGAGTSVMFAPANLYQYPRFADMLNLKYIITPNLPDDLSEFDPNSQKFIMEIKNHLARYTSVYRGRNFTVFQNDSVLPRAYIVPQYRIVKESDVLNILKSKEFDPKKIVILEEDPNVLLSNDEATLISVNISDYTANKITCKTDSPYSGFLVLTDNWHPDWKVFVDGGEQKLYRANYTFRAVHLTAGKHEVVFKYISHFFNIGKIISIIAFIVAIGLCIITIKFKI
ncbi:hypothetical protein AMJ52_06700 [candidate division TA06 bacterium DG_78]|uniref:Membrane protein 6-pyruvoyl-tetrahydropterin synthase-related domain-containing protein n=1 Tax=candidate division TA06 bacterium DG_78 TaxID=1703772 RepID=A0A0S7YBY7_UNCT6|nr:MAG: hypothetical protein AMJ52_06700 [candidate division TA06 bacterium DG_78]